MTVTEHDKTRRVQEPEPEARRLRREFFSDDVLDQLLASADARGVALTGPGGFIPKMLKAVLERGMERRTGRPPGL